jgi:hypothetical protein
MHYLQSWDHTTSNTALNVPIERLAKRAKEAGLIALVRWRSRAPGTRG